MTPEIGGRVIVASQNPLKLQATQDGFARLFPSAALTFHGGEGLELGEADNRLHGRADSKRETGTVGILTGDAVTRRSYYAEAVVLALIPFRNAQLTFGKEGETAGTDINPK